MVINNNDRLYGTYDLEQLNPTGDRIVDKNLRFAALYGAGPTTIQRLTECRPRTLRMVFALRRNPQSQATFGQRRAVRLLAQINDFYASLRHEPLTLDSPLTEYRPGVDFRFRFQEDKFSMTVSIGAENAGKHMADDPGSNADGRSERDSSV